MGMGHCLVVSPDYDPAFHIQLVGYKAPHSPDNFLPDFDLLLRGAIPPAMLVHTSCSFFVNLKGPQLQVTHSPVLKRSQKKLVEIEIDKSRGEFRLLNHQARKGEDQVWKVVDQEERIRQGDLLKLGSLKLRVKSLKLKEPLQRRRSEEMCKICMQDEYSVLNPMLHPCKCDGSLSLVHLFCLKQLLEAQHARPGRAHLCSICSSPIQTEFNWRGQQLSVYSQKQPPYVVFTTTKTQSKNKEYSLSFANKSTARLGRSSRCLGLQNQPTVQQQHLELQLRNGQFIVRDLGSQHGTMVSWERESLGVGDSVRLQARNWVFDLVARGEQGPWEEARSEDVGQ